MESCRRLEIQVSIQKQSACSSTCRMIWSKLISGFQVMGSWPLWFCPLLQGYNTCSGKVLYAFWGAKLQGMYLRVSLWFMMLVRLKILHVHMIVIITWGHFYVVTANIVIRMWACCFEKNYYLSKRARIWCWEQMWVLNKAVQALPGSRPVFCCKIQIWSLSVDEHPDFLLLW